MTVPARENLYPFRIDSYCFCCKRFFRSVGMYQTSNPGEYLAICSDCLHELVQNPSLNPFMLRLANNLLKEAQNDDVCVQG